MVGAMVGAMLHASAGSFSGGLRRPYQGYNRTNRGVPLRCESARICWARVLTLMCHPDYITGHTARRPLTRCDFAPSKLLTDERGRASDLGRKPKASTAFRFTGKRDHLGSGLFDK